LFFLRTMLHSLGITFTEGISLLTVGYSHLKSCFILALLTCSPNAFGLSCPMGYRQDVFGCVRAIDGRGRFPLCEKSLAYYRAYILPCESDPSMFANCPINWIPFMNKGGCESTASTADTPPTRTDDSDKSESTGCDFGQTCTPTSPVAQPPSDGGGAKTKTPSTPKKADSSGKGGAAESGDEDSSSSSAQKGKKKKTGGRRVLHRREHFLLD
jgi:hypothetical protein